ncbi:MAG: WYL domain-containing protein, partial [Sporichthyaceae bacterium]|nr:WYL domain-containing protein [Sporichthyaceae bacterium]
AGVNFRTAVAAFVPSPHRGDAVLHVRAGAGHALRRRAVATRSAVEGWDELVVAFADAEILAEEVCGFGPDVRVLAPGEVRDAVVRRLSAVLECHPLPQGVR